jgi:hypothetical protein
MIPKLILMLPIFLLTACSAAISMFPLEGPLRTEAPNQVLSASAENVSSNSGRFSVTYPNGDVCVGRWASIAPQLTSASWGSLFTQYGALSGASIMTTNMPGINRGEAMAICASGNRLQVEFYTGSGTANGSGVAKDERGNVFKLIF